MTEIDAIRFNCDHCGRQMQVASTYAVPLIKCDGCGESLHIPNQAIDNSPPYRVEQLANESTGGNSPRQDLRRDQCQPILFVLVRREQFGTIFLATIAMCWILWLLLVVARIDVLDFISQEPGDSVATPGGLFIVATIVTLLLGPLAALRYSRAFGILSRGIRVECTILKKSKYGKAGMIDVTFQYKYGGKTFSPTQSISRGDVGAITHLIIDPQNPKRYIVDQ